MKKTSILVLFLCTIAAQLTAQTNSPETDLVIAFEPGDKESIMQVYSSLEDNDDYRVINSCEILGMVVVEALPGAEGSRSTTRAYLDVLLSGLTDMPDYDILEDRSKVDVPILCREAMREALDPEGN